MKTNKVIQASLMSVLLFMASCASIISKSDYPVTLSSSPEGASVKVLDHTGNVVYNGTTPTTVTLSASKGFFSAASYQVVFSKNGFEQTSTNIKAGIDGWYIANLLFGGLIGFLIIDPATGNMWRLDDAAFATLPQKLSMDLKSGKQLHILSLDDVPEEFHKNLVAIK